MSINWRMVKHIVVYPHNGMLLAIQRYELLKYSHHMDGSKSIREWSKPDSKYVLYDSTYTTFCKRQNTKGRIPIRGCQGLGMWGRDWLQRGTRKLFGVLEAFWIVIVVLVLWPTYVVKNHRTIHLNRANGTVYKQYLNKPDFKEIKFMHNTVINILLGTK